MTVVDWGVLTRTNADGSPDASFGGGGRSSSVPFSIETIALSPSGKIAVAGRKVFSSTVYVAQFNPDGSLDAGFGKAGIVSLTDSAGITEGSLVRIAPLGDGYMVGIKAEVLGKPSFLVAITATGAPDPNFGTKGVTRIGGTITDFHVLPDGATEVAGTHPGQKGCCDRQEGDLFVARFSPNGKPDSAFGTDKGETIVDAGGIDVANVVLWQEDGSVVIGGGSQTGTASCLRFRFCSEVPILAEVTARGLLDSSFGTSGLIELKAVQGSDVNKRGVSTLAPRSGGGVFAAGASATAAFLAATNSAGDLDPTFGVDGVVAEREPVRSTSKVEDVTIDRKRRILVAGTTDAGTALLGGSIGAVVRYRQNGELDRSFGGDGYVTAPAGASEVAIDRRNRAIVLGAEGSVSITRLTATGKADSSFGREGAVQIDPHFRRKLNPNSIAILPGGGILVAGQVEQEGDGPRMAVVRLRPNGTLQRSFGRGGWAILGLGRKRSSGVRKLVVQPDGRLLLAGYLARKGGPGETSGTLSLVRLTPKGTLDHSFGHKGWVVSKAGKETAASGLALQNGMILAAGIQQLRSGQLAELLVRFRANGRLDRSFGRRGVSQIPAGAPNGIPIPGESLTVLPTGGHRLVVIRSGSGRAVNAFTRDGHPEPSFGGSAELLPDRLIASYYPLGPVGAVQDGKPILAWSRQITNDAGGVGSMISLQRLADR